MNRFIIDTFHGQEAQEATLEYLESLSMYEKVKSTESFAGGLKAIRDEIIKHVNLVPKSRQTEANQNRRLKKAVRSFRWTRATTARAHELDFWQMYATLKSQAIEEDRGREMQEGKGLYRSRAGTSLCVIQFGLEMSMDAIAPTLSTEHIPEKERKDLALAVVTQAFKGLSVGNAKGGQGSKRTKNEL